MVDDTEIARVAAGLTRAQRYELQVATTTADQRCLVYVTDAPWPQGLCQYYSTKRDRLTPLGLAVRDHILREKSGG